MNNIAPDFILSLIKMGFFGFIIWLIFSIALFLIIREITLWYFKINKNTESLDRIATSIERLSALIGASMIKTNAEEGKEEGEEETEEEETEEEEGEEEEGEEEGEGVAVFEEKKLS